MFSVADEGVLVYRAASAPGTFQLTWVDRQGKTLGTFGPQEQTGGLSCRRIGRAGAQSRKMLPTTSRAISGCWTLPAVGARVSRSRRTCTVRQPCGLRTAPVLRIGRPSRQHRIPGKAASGLSNKRVLLREPGLRHYPTSWSRDGRFLLYHTENALERGYDLWALSLSDRQPQLMLGEAFNEWAGVFSPDMRWIAYGYRWNWICVRGLCPPVPSVRADRPAVSWRGQVADLEGPRQLAAVAHRQGDRLQHGPTWNSSLAAPVNTTGAAFESVVAQRLPFPPSVGVTATPQSTPDGRRFLVEAPLDHPAARSSISVVLNWPALVKK